MRKSNPCWLTGSAWAANQEGDTWVREAQKIGYACRSAFKLIQIDEKFKIFSSKHTHCVLDIGSNPGSWIQVASSRSNANSFLVGVDRKISNSVLSLDLGIRVIRNGQTHRLCKTANQHKLELVDGDISNSTTQEKIKALIRHNGIRASVIQADISPDRSGDNIRDYTDAARLNSDILYFITRDGILDHGGHFVCKVLGGGGYTRVIMEFCRRNFEKARIYKPESSRSTSSEQYIVAQFYNRDSLQVGDNHRKVNQKNGIERFGIDSWPGLVSRQRNRY